MYLLLLKFF